MLQIEAAKKISATEEFREIVFEMFNVAATSNPVEISDEKNSADTFSAFVENFENEIKDEQLS